MDGLADDDDDGDDDDNNDDDDGDDDDGDDDDGDDVDDDACNPDGWTGRHRIWKWKAFEKRTEFQDHFETVLKWKI